ncbi:MAG TPA: threonine--tRNA ligase [Kiritimatiellia bacterium]|nr:threonine--tRNA ligase [Kiritimatiellia bacterium]
MKLDTSSDLYKMRHSAAHVLATAVCRLYGDVQLDIGPPTEDGFYYDFDLPHRLTPEDFAAIEAEMGKIIAEDQPFERMEVSRAEAEKIIGERGQKFKIERLADIPDGDAITFYRNGEFLDLCRGPHVESTGKIKAFKLLNVAGSYYRGKETNPMLQRVYGTAHISEKQLNVYLKLLEEAKLRDHRKLGKELDLFSIQEDVGPGLIHWHPKGARIRCLIEDYWRKEHFRGGYELLYTPHCGRAALWETSGHLGFYRESMYASMKIDENEYFIKPMNCPFHIEIYKTQKRSYRDLPLRWAELGTVYRYEKAGVLHGLLRVRGFTQDDAHLFCTPEQMESEIIRVIRFAINIWHTFGFESITAYLSTRPAKAVGEEHQWNDAIASLEKALKMEGIPYEVDEGGGAFYGPKIDMKVKDAIGREWQMTTIQFDFNLPERFDLTYVGDDNKEHRPYMIHRALFGSIERFFGILTEHYIGAFPVWLAPEQVRVLTLTDNQREYAAAIAETLRTSDFRVTMDDRSEKIGAKIRNAQLQKIPYMLIVGAKEQEAGMVAVRGKVSGDIGVMSLEDFMSRLRVEEESKGKQVVTGTTVAAQ